jgi:hypothetical protein
VRFTDQDVVLVRTDLMPQLALSNIQMHQFKNLSALAVPGGRISILSSLSEPAKVDEEIHALCDALIASEGRLTL